jgi:hypothetical protein
MLAGADMAAAARGRGGSSARAGAFHHHHHHPFVGSAFFFGTTVYPWGPGYPYTLAMPYATPAVVYVEQYPGTPTPETQDWIFCPRAGASYPDVQECPGGWQRVIPHPELAPAPGG